MMGKILLDIPIFFNLEFLNFLKPSFNEKFMNRYHFQWPTHQRYFWFHRWPLLGWGQANTNKMWRYLEILCFLKSVRILLSNVPKDFIHAFSVIELSSYSLKSTSKQFVETQIQNCSTRLIRLFWIQIFKNILNQSCTFLDMGIWMY